MCLSLLVGAVAVALAVHLIESVWVALLVILGSAAGLVVGLTLLRDWRRGW